VQLPIVAVYSEPEEERCHPPAALDENRSLPEEVSLTNVDVLVVDDEIDARNLVKRLLEMAGATVSMAASSSEAMERILARRPDVLVCDIGMPGEDGYSLIRRLRAIQKVQENALPAVALSAYARSEDRTKSIRAGFQNHLAKPVEPSELLAIVGSLAGRTAATSDSAD
jgi:CheY-like chemotaxis protein